MNESKINIENILKLYEKPSSGDAIKEAFRDILPKKSEKKNIYIILLIFSIIVAGIISSRESTVTICIEVISDFNTVIVALFGIVFTGYSLFQALVDQDVLEKMVTKEMEEKTYLQISNDYFLNVMLINIVAIILNVCVLIFLKIIPNSFCLFTINIINELISFLLLSIYLIFQLRVLVEIKSFVFNMYQLFNISSGIKILKMLKEDNKNNE